MVLNNYMMVTGDIFKTGNEKSGRFLKFVSKIQQVYRSNDLAT